VLGTILSRGTGIFYGGEMYRFPYPIFDPGDPNRMCSCGSPVDQCPFWTGIREEARARSPLLSDLRRGQTRYDAWHRLPLTLLNYLRHDPALGRYAAQMTEFAALLAARSGASVVVESSYNPLRGILYRRAPPGAARVRFLHLVRDGRNFVASETSGAPLGPDAGSPFIRSPPAIIARWMVFHTAAVAFCSRGRNDYLRVRFEDVVARPRAALGAIQQFLGIDLSEAIELVEAHRPLPMVHVCAGNRTRLTGSLVVRPELARPPRLPRAHALLFWAMAGWLALLFGYRPGSPGESRRPAPGR
jgi:sulfotransferase family protein